MRSSCVMRKICRRDQTGAGKEKMQASIYITVDTLKYLKKGGRITPAAAAIGTVLNLKPVLQIQGEKLDAFAKSEAGRQRKDDAQCH